MNWREGVARVDWVAMDILYISPEFPPNYANFIRHLHTEGVRVWAIGEAEFFSMPADLRSWIRWYARTDLSNWRAVERALGELLEAKHALGFEGTFDLVESHNEQWLRLEAFINERCDIAGIRLQDIAPLQKKSVMKRVFLQSGLRIARGGVVSSFEEADQLAGELGYPIILKPNEGVGAGGVQRVESRPDLETRMAGIRQDTLLEEFIEAPIVTYDGLSDRNGTVIFENTLIYGEGLIEYLNGKDTFFYVGRTLPAALAATGKALVARFEIRRKFFHFEFFVIDGAYVPIEINCRPPGGAILDMMNYSIDGDLYRAYACMITGRPLDLPREKGYFVGYVGRKDSPHALGHEALVARLGPSLLETAENPPLYWDIMGRTRYIFRSPEENDIIRLAAVARQRS
jgi:hypothetical protein